MIFLWLASLLSLSFAQTCPKGEYWVAPFHRRAYVKADGVSYSAAEVVGHCKSKGKHFEYWTERLQNGIIDGWTKTENFKDWTSNEISTTIRAFGKVPQFLWLPIKVYRAKSSKDKGNPASSADEVMVLYDEAFENRGQTLDRYILHELAHEHFRNMSDLEQQSFKTHSGWKLKETHGKSEERLSRPRSVSHDSRLDPSEDFANSMEYFVKEPAKLKFKVPKVYDWFALEYGDKIKK